MRGRPSVGPSSSSEFWSVIGLCVFAALRVLFFSAVFPFFNNVDERRHFDLVIKYAEGHVPRSAEPISPATLPYLSHYASPEFLSAPEDFEGGYFGPMWKHPAEEVAPTIARIEDIWSRTPNQESSQPPLYYVVAAAWFHVGQWIGLKGGSTLYWVRFLNVAFMTALVWLAYVAAKLIFPEQVAMRLGVPLLIAAVPQDAFYGIDNDVLSPICFGLLFICLIRWFSQGKPSISLGIVTGLSIAAAYLTKLGNLPLIIVAVGAILWWCILEARAWRLRGVIPPLGALAVCAAIPIVAWLFWMKTHFGDFTGTASKAELLGWTTKQFSDWWSHPIFTAPGMWTFLSELIASFWRGEFMWHAHTVGFKGMDLFYVLSSLGLILITVISLLRERSKRTSQAQRRVLWIAVACVIATIVFLGFVSLQFDFGACINPSRERPYFFQGRLMLGALIPFATLYVYGLSRLLRHESGLVLAAIAAITVTITVSDLLANRVAFTSAYNWFHM
jgi:branched-subunit amino acid transport protein